MIPATATMAQAETSINNEESGGAQLDDSQIAYVATSVANLVGFNVVSVAPKPFYLRKLGDPPPAKATKCWPSAPEGSNGVMILQGALTLVVGYRGT